MDVFIDRSPDSPWIEPAVELHDRALSYRSFITLFGRGFLRRLYRALLEERVGFLVVATEGGELRGFILASLDSARLMPLVVKRAHRFLPGIVRTVARHPSSLVRLAQTLLYSRKVASDVAPELVVIAVQEGHRSAGLGAQLLQRLREELARAGVDRFKVTVHEVMEGSNRFYLRHGFELQRTFELYGVRWNLYVGRTS